MGNFRTFKGKPSDLKMDTPPLSQAGLAMCSGRHLVPQDQGKESLRIWALVVWTLVVQEVLLGGSCPTVSHTVVS